MNDFNIKINTKVLICIVICFMLPPGSIKGQALKEVIKETSLDFAAEAPFLDFKPGGYDFHSLSPIGTEIWI